MGEIQRVVFRGLPVESEGGYLYDVTLYHSGQSEGTIGAINDASVRVLMREEEGNQITLHRGQELPLASDYSLWTRMGIEQDDWRISGFNATTSEQLRACLRDRAAPGEQVEAADERQEVQANQARGAGTLWLTTLIVAAVVGVAALRPKIDLGLVE